MDLKNFMNLMDLSSVVGQFLYRIIEPAAFSGVAVGLRALAGLEMVRAHRAADDFPVLRDADPFGEGFGGGHGGWNKTSITGVSVI